MGGVGGRGGVQREEHVVLSVLEVEVEFKKEEDEEQVILSVLEVEVEFKKDGEEEQLIRG